jgi:DNA sulfur modification protein DndD
MRDRMVKERVRVMKDDVPDSFLSEHWNDVVEELIPIGVSQLFFFDAEKIRFLADDETDTAALGAAIKSLLGLDLAERLIADAVVVEKRLADTVLSREGDDKIANLQQALEASSAELTAAKADRASLENPLLRAKKALDKAKTAFAAAGGEHWSKLADVQAELHVTEASIANLKVDLREQCSADLPLLLLPDLLNSLRARDDQEQQVSNARAFNDVLKARDKKLLKEAKAAKLTSKTLETLRSLFQDDRDQRLLIPKSAFTLDLSGHTRTTLARLTSSESDESRRRLRKQLTKWNSLQAKRDKLLRQQNAAPADESIASLVNDVNTCAERHGSLEGDARRLDERIETLRKQRDEADLALARVRQAMVTRSIEHEEALRMAKLANRTQSTMREFLHRATAFKIERLSDHVTRSFQFLLRKQSLVARVRIHPETFRIDLYDDAGKVLSKGRLSEGEKQIFAIAVLWGLAKASPRQLPSIVDTPMARLDSEHRQHLVERYFPNASHQVIILSTDTEVERGYFEHLRPRIARCYHLAYDDGERSTRVEDGYFWATDVEKSK